jgi:hypothetical protein
MSFASGTRELRRGALTMLETQIVMNSLISRLILILMFRPAFTLMLHLALLHVLFLSSLMDLTIAHMVLVHEGTALCLDALDRGSRPTRSNGELQRIMKTSSGRMVKC